MYPLFFVVVIKYSIPYSMVLVNGKHADFADKKEHRMGYFGVTIAGIWSIMSRFLLFFYQYSFIHDIELFRCVRTAPSPRYATQRGAPSPVGTAYASCPY